MAQKSIIGGTVHVTPTDMQKAITSNKATLAAWENLTPLARNEWICWVTSVKKEETRKEHVERVVSDVVLHHCHAPHK